MAWGIELRGNGHKIGWAPESYLDSLEENLKQALDRQAEAVDRDVVQVKRRVMDKRGPLYGVLDDALAAIDGASRRSVADLALEEFGVVTYIGQGVARVQGLPHVKSEELIRFEGDLLGMAFNLDPDESRCGSVGRLHEHRVRIPSEADKPRAGRPSRRSPAGTRCGRCGAAVGRCRAPEQPPARADRVRGPRDHGSSAGNGAARHGNKGYRRTHPRGPRTARVDSR